MIRCNSLGVPYQTAFSNGSVDAVADVPVEKGGAGHGFGPHELLEAALATCLTMTVQLCAAKHDLPLGAVRCVVRIDRTDPDAPVLSYHMEFDGPLTTGQVSLLRAEAARCPVGRTLTGRLTLMEG